MNEAPSTEQQRPPEGGPGPGPAGGSGGVDLGHLRDYRELRRSRTDRKVAGVAGGLARHLDIDPTVLRVLFVVLCLFGGAGFVLYGAAWLLVPEEGRSVGLLRASPATRNTLLLVAAVVAGSVLVARSWGGFGFPWPLAVVALIGFILLTNRDRSVNTQYSATPTAPPTGPQPPQGPPPTAPGRPGVPPGWMPPPAQQRYQPPPPPPPPPPRGPRLFGLTLALVALALGLLGLYDAAGNSVVGSAYAALALTVVGVMLVVGAWVGRAGGLILLGIVAVVALAVTSLGSPRFDGARDLRVNPVVAGGVHDRYVVSAGTVRLDLRGVANLSRLDGRTLSARVKAGEIVVILPRGLHANVDATVGIGEARVTGTTRDGTQIHLRKSVGPVTGAPDVDLDLNVLVGDIQVRQP